MPSPAPFLPDECRETLMQLGAALRTRRKALGLSTIVVAESAALSRVTLSRIEKGEPSVTVGAWLAVAHTLGLSLSCAPREDAPLPIQLPALITLAHYPQLRQLAWHIPHATTVTPREALDIYRRHSQQLQPELLTLEERLLMAQLEVAEVHGHV